MDIRKIEAIIEGILFAIGESLDIKKIANAVDQDVETTRKILLDMKDRYENEDRGIRIIELDSSYQLTTKSEYFDYLVKVVKQPKKYELTEIQLETLSIIAYKQPVTKQDIEKIRGVNSDHVVNKLLEYDLIEEKGRLQVPGRPVLFGTNENFLRLFQVKSTDELPNLNPDEILEMEEEAEKVAQIDLEL
ncbi:MAG: SMC-Scp complex subunit ScpB [Lachnospiraceae bacterium]|jgi:segregation and condensation protein B|nr:SMC-Scp complex subunit ScpB [Lachnospiraceae bacterium]